MVAKKTAGSTPKKAAEQATAAGQPTTGGGNSPAGRASAAKTPAAKAPAKKAPTKKASVKSVKKGPAEKVAAVEAPAARAGTEGAAQAARETGARTVVAKKSTGTGTGAARARRTATAATSGLPRTQAAEPTAPGGLRVRPGEEPWTPEEVARARTELTREVLRLRDELEASEVAISGLMRDSGDGAGDDQADTGTKNITRESELALAANASSMLEQTERALERLEAGTYGLCENCGKPIGKARMQAFPRATLCVDCKQRQERRH
ncbi:TraR/DksA family transcriptional regulator [Streptomyces sp. NPDC051567]|uniref:TraR/DksA family transcriptional regulator n=1 Tax=Streptomyces sp. NPDC051567 TaxID=3365660 RepID=UPI0037B82D16